MSDVSAKALRPNLPVDGAGEREDSISFASLLRKLVAFTVVIFLFYFAIPLPEINYTIVSGLGIDGTWYRDIPVALCVAGFNAAFAIAAFRLVR